MENWKTLTRHHGVYRVPLTNLNSFTPYDFTTLFHTPSILSLIRQKQTSKRTNHQIKIRKEFRGFTVPSKTTVSLCFPEREI